MRLTQYSHGSGWACKLAPSELAQVLKQFEQHKALKSENLIVGLENPDDGGVINVGETKIIQTVDFFTPILDSPYDWGRVAAANALSDIYAMGGEPLSALQLVCWPREEIGFDVLAEVINGGLDIMGEAGCTVIGGHSIDDKEPKYGFSVTGIIKDNPLLNNSIADKDKLYITKPLGIGIIATAIKKDIASKDEILEATNTMVALNKDAVLPFTTVKYMSSLIVGSLSLLTSNISPSEIVTLVSAKSLRANSLSSLVINWKARLKRKSPTKTLVLFPQISLAVSLPLLFLLKSTISSCNKVAAWMNSTAAARLMLNS